MKNYLKITQKTVLVFITLFTLNSCTSDDGSPSSDEKQIVQIVKNFQNTGNKTTLNYENSDKLINSIYTNTLNNFYTNEEYEYNGERMLKYSNYDENGGIDFEYTFNYSTNGDLNSFHLQNDTFSNSEPEHQDVEINWNENILSFNIITDTFSNEFIKYQFSFNNNDLLTNISVVNEGVNDLDYQLTYDSEGNLINLSGFTHNFFGEPINQNVNLVNDNKINPYYPFYKKYIIQHLITLSRENFLSGYNFMQALNTFGPNNFLEFNNVIGEDPENEAYYEFTYNGDYPTQSNYRSNVAIATITDFIYDN